MRIQATNAFYTGTYSVLNTKSSFPDGAKSLDKLREQQYKHGGIV